MKLLWRNRRKRRWKKYAVSGIQRTGAAIFQRRLRRKSDDRKSGRGKDAGIRAVPDGRTGVPESI